MVMVAAVVMVQGIMGNLVVLWEKMIVMEFNKTEVS